MTNCGVTNFNSWLIPLLSFSKLCLYIIPLLAVRTSSHTAHLVSIGPFVALYGGRAKAQQVFGRQTRQGEVGRPLVPKERPQCRRISSILVRAPELSLTSLCRDLRLKTCVEQHNV